MLLSDVLATERLALRAATKSVAPAIALLPFELMTPGSGPHLWDVVADHVRTLCGAQSAGVSIFADPKYDELTWASAAGALAEFRTRRFPRRHSLCGVCLERRSPQLFINPHLYFAWIAQAGVEISEALVVPLYSGDTIYGTIWVMVHEGEHQFDRGDLDVLVTVAARATAYLDDCRASVSA